METPLFEPRCAEFCFPHLDTRVRVEVSDEFVTIRATRDSFSPRRKDFFIRELAAEGFIPDRFQWSSPEDAGSPIGRLRWRVDHAWLSLGQAGSASARRTAFRFLTIAVLLLSLLLELGLPGLLGNSRAAMRSEKPVAAQMQKSSNLRLDSVMTSEQAADADPQGHKSSENAKLPRPGS
jgi:hypothetical protein